MKGALGLGEVRLLGQVTRARGGLYCRCGTGTWRGCTHLCIRSTSRNFWLRLARRFIKFVYVVFTCCETVVGCVLAGPTDDISKAAGVVALVSLLSQAVLQFTEADQLAHVAHPGRLGPRQDQLALFQHGLQLRLCHLLLSSHEGVQSLEGCLQGQVQLLGDQRPPLRHLASQNCRGSCQGKDQVGEEHLAGRLLLCGGG